MNNTNQHKGGNRFEVEEGGHPTPYPVETDAKVLPIFVCKIVDSVLMKSKYANIYVCAVVGSNLTLITTHSNPSQRRDHQGSLTCCSPGFQLEIYRYYTPAVFVSRKTPGDLPGPRLFSNIFPPFSLPLPPALTPTPSIGL